MGLGMQIHMEAFDDHILVVWDIINAFNEFERAALMEHCRANPKYHDLFRYLESELRPRSHIYSLVNGRLQLVPYRSAQGGQQGAYSAGAGHNIVTLPHFKEVDAAVKARGGCARAIMDDLAVAGHPGDVWPALQRLEEQMFEIVGLRKHLTKPSVYSRTGRYGNMPLAGYHVGTNGGGDTGLELGHGVVLAGVPIGDEIFKRNYVALEVGRVRGVIDSVLPLLRTSNKSRDHAFHVDRLSLSHMLDFVSQTTPPTREILALLRGADDHRLAALASSIGIDPLAPPLASEGLADLDLVKSRCFLPVRERGLGLTRNADTARAAFVGALELVVPRFPDVLDPEGNGVPGLFPHLAPVVGTFSQREGRWGTFIETVPMGRVFQEAWDAMRAEAGGLPGAVLGPDAANAPGTPHEDDEPRRPGESPRLQRLLTRQLGRVRAAAMRVRMDQLPPEDQRGVAWHFAKERALFTTLPEASTVFGQHEFPAAVALYLGLPDPLIVDSIAASGGSLSHFRDLGVPEGLRPLDRWGNNLSLYMGRGHGRTVYHNDIQRELSRLARAVGHNVRETPQDVFLPAIVAGARARYLQQLRRERGDGDFRGGVVPDIYDPSSKQMYDVKTTGFKQDAYIGRRSPVDEKAAAVPGQYRLRARAADAEYNDTPGGVVGSIEALLATMPQVECFSVGAFGETNRAVHAFLNVLVDKGSDTPERFGCCHGKEQAKGVVAQFLGRRLGRTLLRGAVRFRHVALAAVGGIGGQEPGAARQVAGHLGDEW